jgi:hypothetical protein
VEIAQNLPKTKIASKQGPSPVRNGKTGHQEAWGSLDRSNWIRSKIQPSRRPREHGNTIG